MSNDMKNKQGHGDDQGPAFTEHPLQWMASHNPFKGGGPGPALVSKAQQMIGDQSGKVISIEQYGELQADWASVPPDQKATVASQLTGLQAGLGAALLANQGYGAYKSNVLPAGI